MFKAFTQQNSHNKISITVSESKITAEILPVFSWYVFFAMMQPILLADAFIFGSRYLATGTFLVSVPTVGFTNALILVFLVARHSRKVKFTLHPYKRTAAVKQTWGDVELFKWRDDYQLAYHNKYDERNKSQGIELFAKSPGGEKEIPIFVFRNSIFFERFLETYKQAFADVAIQDEI